MPLSRYPGVRTIANGPPGPERSKARALPRLRPKGGDGSIRGPMNVTSSASITIPRARESVFELSTKNETYERALLPYGPVAGVAESKLLEGRALQRGARREIKLTDGAVLTEEILEHDVPTRHRYKWTSGLKPPFAWLVRSGEGTWTFSEVAEGTRIDWSLRVRAPLTACIPNRGAHHRTVPPMAGKEPRPRPRLGPRAPRTRRESTCGERSHLALRSCPDIRNPREGRASGARHGRAQHAQLPTATADNRSDAAVRSEPNGKPLTYPS